MVYRFSKNDSRSRLGTLESLSALTLYSCVVKVERTPKLGSVVWNSDDKCEPGRLKGVFSLHFQKPVVTIGHRSQPSFFF